MVEQTEDKVKLPWCLDVLALLKALVDDPQLALGEALAGAGRHLALHRQISASIGVWKCNFQPF